ncbi:trichothecene biosynthesis acetyltransferase, putative [Metarhizium acridum CQMa 102]|uniref:Trichothecene biosynthesis acetyltransferase, putative n=1 Tax=Metarhizium acridum (strain CQMa 102) TaxID=655827 RepID=E9EIK7_METAQ|nr:trichothecene biosynthesis acetyltransferase, putative [Metarhizium acridum CQMa 102]EFY84243.1 trichothecene biosynthesis acetyltransferase, putative [Metarhizium acridum CQMa 102]
MGQVVSLSLSNLAQMLRRELNAANTPWAIRSYATFLSREPDNSRLSYAGTRNFDTDLGMTVFTSSQSTRGDDGEAMPADFGPLLGRLKYSRRPNCSPLTGGITICPVEDGAIPIVVCLPQADIDGLQKDSEWTRCASSVG